MKRTLALLLALVMTLSLIPAALAAPASGTAYPSTQNVDVDGKAVEFQMYALKDENGNDTNYVKVRDVAYTLNGTAAQFSVGWDGAVNLIPGQSYAANGSEMTTPFSGERAYAAATAPTNVNGQAATLEAIVLNDDNGGGYTYYKLRDLGAALGFTVDWSAEKGVFITTGNQTAAADTSPYPVKIYTPDGQTYEVMSTDVDAYVAQGCYTYPVTTIYSANGGSAVVATAEVDTYTAQGWYTYPVTTVYKADGASVLIASSELDAYLAQGWVTDPGQIKVNLYAADGRILEVSASEVDAYLTQGWYRTPKEAYAKAGPFDPKKVKVESIMIGGKPLYFSITNDNSAPIQLDDTLYYSGENLRRQDALVVAGGRNVIYTYQYLNRLPDTGSGYVYFHVLSSGEDYKITFTKKGSSSRDISYSITKLR